jgi:hypothetical protein
LMGYVHMHRRIHAIEGWGNPNDSWSVVKKTK